MTAICDAEKRHQLCHKYRIISEKFGPIAYNHPLVLILFPLGILALFQLFILARCLLLLVFPVACVVPVTVALKKNEWWNQAGYKPLKFLAIGVFVSVALTAGIPYAFALPIYLGVEMIPTSLLSIGVITACLPLAVTTCFATLLAYVSSHREVDSTTFTATECEKID